MFAFHLSILHYLLVCIHLEVQYLFYFCPHITLATSNHQNSANSDIDNSSINHLFLPFSLLRSMAWLNSPKYEITLTKQHTHFLKISSQAWLPNKQGTKKEFKQRDYEIKMGGNIETFLPLICNIGLPFINCLCGNSATFYYWILQTTPTSLSSTQ